MKRRYDIIHAVVLVLFLVVANYINNTIIKGILLLLFSIVLSFNTVMNLKLKKDDKPANKIFYGILLFMDAILVLGAILVIITAIIEVV